MSLPFAWYSPASGAAAVLLEVVASTVESPVAQGMDNQFIAFHDGSIDPTLHKIESGISA